MSHSTCLVIIREAEGPEHAEALAEEFLAPFDENLEVTPYREYEEGDPADHWFVRYLAVDGRPLTPPITWCAVADAHNAEYPAEAPLRVDDRGAYSMSTYNPRSKWDWYALGGRWTGYWPLKPVVGAAARIGSPGAFSEPAEAGTADIARKRDIDFDFKRREAVIDAEARYTVWEGLSRGLATGEFRSWEQVVEDCGHDYERARAIYGEQPLVRASRTREAMDDLGWDVDVKELLDGREAYVTRAEESALSTFAVLDGADWYERGHMGWFGMVSDELDHDTWTGTFSSLIDNLPDDAWLAVYDLHI